jgi:hypothetical protein
MPDDNKRPVGMSFPSNSHREKEETKKEETKKVNKVVTGVVVQRKKSLGKKFVETFIGEDINNVGAYILYDVLIPAAKDTIADIVKGGIEMLLFPSEKRNNRTRREGGKSYVSYNNFSSSRDRDRREERRTISQQGRARHNFDEIILESRGDAEEVLNCLVDLTIDYGQATVADLYDAVGMTGNFTDNKYGWTDLSSASASRTRNGGYVLNLPKPVLLD